MPAGAGRADLGERLRRDLGRVSGCTRERQESLRPLATSGENLDCLRRELPRAREVACVAVRLCGGEQPLHMAGVVWRRQCERSVQQLRRDLGRASTMRLPGGLVECGRGLRVDA